MDDYIEKKVDVVLFILADVLSLLDQQHYNAFVESLYQLDEDGWIALEQAIGIKPNTIH